MDICICLTKDDIATQRFGDNFHIKIPNGYTISFTKEALVELVTDADDFFKEKGNFAPGKLGENKTLERVFAEEPIIKQ